MRVLSLLFLIFSFSSFAQTKALDNGLGTFVTGVMDGLKSQGKVVCDETVGSSSVSDVNGESIPVSTISLEYAQRLFNELANDPTIPFGYPDDGCYARAHYMSQRLEGRGIVTDKVFVEGDLRVETANSPQGYVEWWYHVAPVVMVRQGEQEVLMVFDPSIFDRPVPVDQWVEIQTRHEGSRVDRVYNTNRFTYTPGSGTTSEDWLDSDLDDMNETMSRYRPLAEERRLAREQSSQRRSQP